MKINFQNYVSTMKLPSSKVLYPLFEAISNSIDSIEDRKSDDGKIVITLERREQMLIVDNDENQELLPIENIVIEDNGMGFNDMNYLAFSELSTIRKKNKGGKGVGRVVWLIAFNYVEVISTYQNGDDQKGCRSFRFVCDDDSIVTHINKEERSDAIINTQVKLVNIKSEYQEVMPKTRSIIAEEIITHFLPYFMVSTMPSIILREKECADIDLWEIFDSYIAEKCRRENIYIGKEQFLISHTKAKYSSQRNKDHRVFYVANGRVVETRSLSPDKIVNLPSKIKIEGEDYVYIGYVESPYLDQSVNTSRYKFDFPETPEGNMITDLIDWEKIEENIGKSITTYLGDFLEKTRLDKDEKIRNFINSKKPSYSYIYAHHKDLIDKIPLRSVEKDNIGPELMKIHATLRTDLAEEAEKIINITDNEIVSSDDYKIKVKDLLERLDPTGKADLAEYIIIRKIVLHLFDKALKIQDDENFVREDVIHNFIFPIRKSSDDITYQKHNLWILDERLAYNTYIASDKQFSQIPGYENLTSLEKRKRPDIYAFSYSTTEPDNTTSPYKSLDIFEFKRPMRNDYQKKENPYLQIKEYLEVIRNGEAITKDQRVFRVVKGGLIYCHIVCDFTKTLTTTLKSEDFYQVGNYDWYIYYHRQFNALIEVKSFEFMIETATKRNQILFDKLGLK